jgi:hypothetical protein
MAAKKVEVFPTTRIQAANIVIARPRGSSPSAGLTVKEFVKECEVVTQWLLTGKTK